MTSPATRPVIALLTDFGTRDHYVGAVKGVLLSVCPEAQLVDVAHDLPAHDVAAAGFGLVACYRFFPSGTVFLAVVDPGVGSARRGIVVDTGDYRLVGPDNGLFTLVLEENRQARVHSIANAAWFRADVAPTFHARDVFGPVAGQLASGQRVELVGPEVVDAVRLPVAPPTRSLGATEWETGVLHVDRFGNLTTQLRAAELQVIVDGLAAAASDAVVVVGGAVIPLVRTYSDVPEGELCALVGSSGRLEIAVRGGSAARALGAGAGARVRLKAAVVSGFEASAK